MGEKTQFRSQTREADRTDEVSLWAAMSVIMVALLALVSAIYFVEISQDELKAANAAGENNPSLQSENTSTTAVSAKK
jgi:lipopolysaccharide export system protein LptC